MTDPERAARDTDDELPFVCVDRLGVDSHSGPGWYYWDSEYPDEGSVGPFTTREEALEHARAAGYGEDAP